VSAPRDPGLQPERTELAWRRTLLALAVGALVSIRVLTVALGDWAIATGLGGVVAAVVLWILAHGRHRAVDAVFTGRAATSTMPGGALLLAVALLTAAGAALGLLALVLR
jgi:hypothetical protein